MAFLSALLKKQDEPTDQKVEANYNKYIVRVEKELRNDSWLCDVNNYIQDIDSMNSTDAALYRDFLIDILGKDMGAFYAYRVSNSPLGESLFSLICSPWMFKHGYRKTTYDVDRNNIISMPEIQGRLLDALSDVKIEGYIQEYETPTAILYKELSLICTTNHRHHTAAAVHLRQEKGISFYGPVISLCEAKPLATDIYSTQDFRFADKKGNLLSEHCDPRFVLCWLLAQHKVAYAQGDYGFKIRSRILNVCPAPTLR